MTRRDFGKGSRPAGALGPGGFDPNAIDTMVSPARPMTNLSSRTNTIDRATALAQTPPRIREERLELVEGGQNGAGATSGERVDLQEFDDAQANAGRGGSSRDRATDRAPEGEWQTWQKVVVALSAAVVVAVVVARSSRRKARR